MQNKVATRKETAIIKFKFSSMETGEQQNAITTELSLFFCVHMG